MRFLFVFLFLVYGYCHSQTLENIAFDQASIPSSPAFVLLDNAPSVIERPDTPKAFGVQLLQDFEDGFVR